MVQSSRNRRRLLILPETIEGDLKEGDITSGSGYQVVKPTITELREDATNLAEIKTHEQRRQFFAKPSPILQDFWIWLRALREARVMGKIVVAESLANVDQEAKVKKSREMLAMQGTKLAGCQAELKRLIEQSNQDELQHANLSKKLDGYKEEAEDAKRIRSLERTLDQMNDEFGEAVANEDDLQKERAEQIFQMEEAKRLNRVMNTQLSDLLTQMMEAKEATGRDDKILPKA